MAAADAEQKGSRSRSLTISCLCGAAARQVVVAAAAPWWPSTTVMTLCHCDTCRHVTGVLCTSYVSIMTTSSPSLSGLVEYSPSSSSSYYFCATCGCHVLRRRRREDRDNWEVATGVIISSPPSPPPPQLQQQVLLWKHAHVQDTRDGGLAVWLPTTPEQEHPPPPPPPPPEDMGGLLLPASCHCGAVSFFISRPDHPVSDDARPPPRANFPDLMRPYCRTPSAVVANPADEKWWIRGDGDGGTRYYLAGTCACRSCRLASGFEIQTWAFVPRANILFGGIGSTAEGGGGQTELKPLDFAALPRGVLLRSYESSVGVVREFCGRCGATVFWHDKWRPDLIDVSVGLLRAPEGARAETWLDWWTDRVSFAEEAGNERAGSVMNWATTLIACLEDGLKKKRQEPCEDEDSR